MPVFHPFSARRAAKVRAVGLFAVAGLAAMLAGCQSGNPLSPESKAILAARPDKPPTVVSGTASRSAIPVLVNDEPITDYDVTQRVLLNQLAGGKADRKSVVEQLIDETLQGQEARRRGIAIPDDQVEGAYAQVASQVKLSPANLNKALASRGIVPDTLKKRLRAQLRWQQLVQARAATEKTVSNSDIVAQITDKGDPAKITLTQYTLQQIIFVVPSGSSSGVYTQRTREAAAFRQRYGGCDGAIAQTSKLKGVVVKNVGRRDESDLAGPQGDLIKKTPIGKAAPPNRIDGGIELIAVCAKKDIQTTAGARAEAENSLFLKQADDLGKAYLKELRDKAIIEYR